MNQIKSIQLGVIAISIATVPLSLAQTPRTRTSGSNQIITTTTTAPIRTGSNGNSIRAPQIGINAGIPTITGATPNIGAHTATNPGVQTGISSHAIGITSAAVGNGGSSGNSTGATQIGTNAAAGTNTTAKAQTGTGTDVKTTQPQVIIESTQLPTLSTPTPSPTSTPSATPMASLAPAPSASVSPSPTPLL
jgi:hypothetical protein